MSVLRERSKIWVSNAAALVNLQCGWLTVTLALQSSVTRRTGQIQDDQLRVVRLVDNHLVQLDGGVHAPNVALVAVRRFGDMDGW